MLRDNNTDRLCDDYNLTDLFNEETGFDFSDDTPSNAAPADTRQPGVFVTRAGHPTKSPRRSEYEYGKCVSVLL